MIERPVISDLHQRRRGFNSERHMQQTFSTNLMKCSGLIQTQALS